MCVEKSVWVRCFALTSRVVLSPTSPTCFVGNARIALCSSAAIRRQPLRSFSTQLSQRDRWSANLALHWAIGQTSSRCGCCRSDRLQCFIPSLLWQAGHRQ